MASRAPAPVTPRRRFAARAALAAAGLVLVAVPFGLLLFLVEDRWTPLLDADRGARDSLHGVAVSDPWLVTVLKVLSFLGSAWVYWPLFTLLALWLLRRGRRRLALFVAVTVGGSAILNALIKVFVHRARPVLPDPVAHANGLSFPSGHAQSAIVAYSVLLLVFWPALRGGARVAAVAGAAAMVLAIGFARIGLGVHFLSDVLAGYALGAAWVAALAWAFRAWRREAG